ncbi:MAG: family 20 glycosylhydrolase [Terriglobia bacterium]|jgi:hexosaminidase
MSRKLALGLMALLLAVARGAPAQHRPLLPRPQEVHYGTGQLALQGLAICFAAAPLPEDLFAGSELSNQLSERGEVSIPIREGNSCPHGIFLQRTGGIDPLPVPGEHPGPDSREAYSLKITSEGATVSARSSAGLYYAIQTLGQLVEGSGAGADLPVVEIKDWPALAYRGVMVDMSHGALPSEKEVERQLEFLARWKANQYYFYSEDSIELKGYPLLNPGGRFSQDEVRRIIAYGRARHVDVIPCLELYGHQHDLFRVEEYATLADMPHGTEFDPRNPQVKSLLIDWVTQLAQLFPSPFVHIGFDEAFQIEQAARQGGMAAQPAQLFIRQLDTVDELFKKYGKTVMAWGDIIVKYPEIVSQLPSGLIAVAWEYDPGPESHYQHWLGPLATQHIPHMIASGVTCWNQVMPDYARSFENIDTFLASGRKSGAMGLMNTLWTDDAQNLLRTAWPGVAYGAAAAWQSSPVDRQNFFADYSELAYPSAVAPEVTQALKDLEAAELALQKAIGDDTMLALWRDPFAPAMLKQSTDHLGDLRQTRLLAEDAATRLEQALSEGGDPVTLQCLLVGSRLLDYAGERFQTAPELEKMWRNLGPRRPKDDEWWNNFESQVTYQDHSRIIDLMDAITELRPQYRAAWLDEYTAYRLDSALVRWEAEAEYWRALQDRFRAFSDSSHEGQPLPPMEKVVEGH